MFWRAQVAHLAEHTRAVNKLAVAGNGAFFVSASNDETVKVWDCRRLEKDVSFKSRLTYGKAAQGNSTPSTFASNIWLLDFFASGFALKHTKN